jgi:hypothetical protein
MSNVPAIFHEDFDGLGPSRVVQLTGEVLSLPWNERLPILAAAGVRSIVTEDELRFPEVRLVATIPNASNRPVFVYELLSWTMQRFVSSARFYSREIQIREELKRGSITPASVALVGAPRATSGACAGTIVPLERRNNSARYSMRAPCNGYAVFALPRYPGWEATIDGRNVEIVAADYAFSAISVPAGEHEIALRYVPRALVRGAIASAVSLLLIVLLLLFDPFALAREPQRVS